MAKAKIIFDKNIINFNLLNFIQMSSQPDIIPYAKELINLAENEASLFCFRDSLYRMYKRANKKEIPQSIFDLYFETSLELYVSIKGCNPLSKFKGRAYFCKHFAFQYKLWLIHN